MFMGNNDILETIGKQFIVMYIYVNGHVQNIRMYDLFHMPKLHSNLLSVNNFILRGFEGAFQLVGMGGEGKKLWDVGLGSMGIYFVPTGHQCDE